MVSARRAADVIPARVRIPSYAVWEFAVFVLNVLALILVGFQLKAILGRIGTPTLVEYAGVADDFGKALTPELRAQEERLRTEVERKRKA